MDAQTLRDKFTAFYVERDHAAADPAPLVPKSDPTLLFNSAGMVQFKKLYAGTEPLPYSRAVTVQPCIRAGGKDSDIENVGRTPRHLSFFEMLGNFSFGDYFKEEAIRWGWEFLTKEVGIDPDRLWVSVYEEDDESAEIWQREVGLPAERIVRLGADDNFWGPAGTTGACGPCSEIYYDLGDHLSGTSPGDDGDRYIEVYNLVFPQYDQQEDGSRPPLANRGIDTGMGLERLAMIVQGGETVFDTDLFRPIIDRLREIAGGVDYPNADPEKTRALRVVADHVRGLTFAIAEGVMPSNEGRGYVLRRLLRRAARRGWSLGIEGPFLHSLSGVVIDHYQKQYPLLRDARERVALAMHAEEERFETTLGTGMARFHDAVGRARKAGEKALAGGVVFTLYDTFGFPLDLLDEMAAEEGVAVDHAGFEEEMERQKSRSRASSKFGEGGEEALSWVDLSEGAHSAFLAYEATTHGGVRVRRYAEEKDRLYVVLDATPFYAESGGQVGDTGRLRFPKGDLEVVDTVKRDGAILHVADRPNDFDPALFAEAGEAEVDGVRRDHIAKNHTATHLLHAALRDTLGTHVTQAGSLVAPDRLRFDFTHFQPLTQDELVRIEAIVAEEIQKNTPVDIRTGSLKEALAAGAMALFGEKYGDEVRQVVVGSFSHELCGGIHVPATGAIGPFLLVSEAGVAAGTRRVEAITGPAAVKQIREGLETIQRLSQKLQAAPGRVEESVESLLRDKQALEKRLEEERASQQRAELGDAMKDVLTLGDVSVIVRRVEAQNVGELRAAADVIRDQLKRGVAILGADVGGKASFLVLVTKDLVSEKRYRADEIVREVAGVAGGSGGGKPDMALAGAKEVAKLDAALEHGRRLLAGEAENEKAGA